MFIEVYFWKYRFNIVIKFFFSKCFFRDILMLVRFEIIIKKSKEIFCYDRKFINFINYIWFIFRGINKIIIVFIFNSNGNGRW